MSAEWDHPRLLLWYVMGDLAEDQSRQVERHVRWCPDCRAEARALSSALETLRQEPSVHAHQEDGAAREAAPALPWSQLPAGASALRAVRARRATAAALLAAAAGGFALALGSAWLVWRPHEPVPSLREVSALMLSPPQRGHSAGRLVAGPGPHAITMVLPFEAREGSYRVRLEREDGSPSSLEATASTHHGGSLTLLLQSTPLQGRYVVLVRDLEGDGAGTPYVYPFEITSGDATPRP